MTELEVMRDLEYCSEKDCERCSRDESKKCSFELMKNAATVIRIQHEELEKCGKTIKDMQDRATMCFSRDELVETVNSVIKQAILHGGDTGGPYFCNWGGIIREMNTFVRLLRHDKYCIVIDHNEYPKIKKCDSV